MFDYQFWFALVATIATVVAMGAALYSAYWQRRSTIMTMEEGANRGVQAIHWSRSLFIIGLFIMNCTVWGPFLLTHWPNEPTMLRKNGAEISGPQDAYGRFLQMNLAISIDGREIWRYAPQKVMAIAFHWPTDMDVDDTQDLQKIAVYDIKNSPLIFYIKTDKKIR